MPDFNAAFRKWFGDSKVVDADGNPLVVYHGTRASFSVFDADIGPDRGGLLAFFSESPKFGAMYSKQGSEEYVEGSNVMPVYLAIQRPFDYRVHWKAAGDYYEFAGGPQDSWELDRLAADHYRVLEEELTDRQRERYGAAQFVKQVKSGSWLPLEIPSFVMYLREQGFDGLRMREMRSVNWGVFEPTQVKSATGNDGTWDADDPDIRSNPGKLTLTFKPRKGPGYSFQAGSFAEFSRVGREVFKAAFTAEQKRDPFMVEANGNYVGHTYRLVVFSNPAIWDDILRIAAGD